MAELRARIGNPGLNYEQVPYTLDENQKNRKKSLLKKLQTRGLSLLWILGSFILIVYGELHSITQDPLFNWTAFMFALTGFGLSTLTFIYLTYFCPWVLNLKVDVMRWQTEAPRAIPFATICGLIGIVGCVVALWPIYHVLALPLCFILYMGFLVTVSLF